MKLIREVSLKVEELRKFQSSTFDTIARRKLVEDQNTILAVSGRKQELQNEINCLSDSKEIQDAESIRSGNSLVSSRPVSFPPHPIPTSPQTETSVLQTRNASVARKCCSSRRPTSPQTETSVLQTRNASVARKYGSSRRPTSPQTETSVQWARNASGARKCCFSQIRELCSARVFAGDAHGNNRWSGVSLLECVVFGRVAGAACAKYMLGDQVKQALLAELSGGGLSLRKWRCSSWPAGPFAAPSDFRPS